VRKPLSEDGKLETAAREPAKAMAPLLEAVQDEVVIRKGEDVGWEAAQATPPT